MINAPLRKQIEQSDGRPCENSGYLLEKKKKKRSLLQANKKKSADEILFLARRGP